MSNCPTCGKPVYFAERKVILGKDWHSHCLRCDNCDKLLTPGQYSAHREKPYCNGCYQQWFGPDGHRPIEPRKVAKKVDSGDISTTEKQKIISKIQEYNLYKETVRDKLNPKEVNGRIYFEGVLKIYWGLTKPITLAPGVMYSKNRESIYDFRGVDDATYLMMLEEAAKVRKRRELFEASEKSKLQEIAASASDSKERMPRREFDYDEVEALSMKLPPGLDGNTNLLETLDQQKKGRGSSEEAEDGTDESIPSKQLMRGASIHPGALNPVRKRSASFRRISRIKKKEEREHASKRQFTPPYGTPTNLRIHSAVKTKDVIIMLLAKFKIENDPSEFGLCIVHDSGFKEPCKEDCYPLQQRLKLGPNEDIAKIFIMEASECQVSSEVTLLVGESDATDHGKAKSIASMSVPLGHTLTHQELQVLRTLLAPYCNSHDKLKWLIQEKQGDISLKEVEILLQQSDLAMIADSLKDDIEKGMENIKHYKAYEKALQDQKSILLRYLKFLFIGPPRSGKTSARRRLLREIINLSSFGKPSKSTGVAETNDVIIKKFICGSTAIVNSEWKSISEVQQEEGDLTYTSLARFFYSLISAETTSSDDANPIISSESSDERDFSYDSDTSSDSSELMKKSHSDIKIKPQEKAGRLAVSEESEIKAALEQLATILQSDSPVELQQLLEELTMINMADIGGQPAILEMLPSLTIGPALYFLFFRLDQELAKSYPVRYHASDKEETALESSYCTEDILYQSLSSIACFGCYSPKDVSSSSRILLFGTYKDQVDENRISQMATTLEEKLSKTKLYTKGLLLKTPSGCMFYSVDNMNGDESEMSKIRSDVEDIVKEYFPATRIPAAWLMFRIVLHLLHKPVISLAQCEAIASKLSMPTSVQEALWFFHHKIGSIMYYSDIRSMQDVVICDPQVIFDSVNQLIIDKFSYTISSNRSKGISAHDKDIFRDRGIFSLPQIDEKTTSQRSGHLKLTQLVDLLQDLNIIAEVKLDEGEDEDEDEDGDDMDLNVIPTAVQSQPKFIMPAVLKYASKDELEIPMTTNESVPIMIRFKSGFVPFGIFCACTANLITYQELPKWKLKPDEVQWRNKVTFVIGGEFSATLISQDEYFKVQVSYNNGAQKLSLNCSTVLKRVVNSLHTVISKMKFKQPYIKTETPFFSGKQLFDLAFTCSRADSHSNHLMRVVEKSEERYAVCLKEGLHTGLSSEQMVWFDKEKKFKSEGQIATSTNIPSPPRGELSSTGSTEYETLICHTVELQLIVMGDLVSLGGELFSTALITASQYRDIRNQYISVDNRAAELVDYIQERVNQDPKHYHTFISILMNNQSQYGDILTKLEKTFKSYTRAAEQQSIVQPPPMGVKLPEGKPVCTETDPQEEKCLDATSDLNSGPPKRKHCIQQ